MKKKKHKISKVLPGSIGEELELEPGDVLAEINHQPVEDVFDYRYLMKDEYVEVLIRKPSGVEWLLEINAVILFASISRFTFFRAWKSP